MSLRFTTRHLLLATFWMAIWGAFWSRLPPWADRADAPLPIWFLTWTSLGASLGTLLDHPKTGAVMGLLFAILFAQVRAMTL